MPHHRDRMIRARGTMRRAEVFTVGLPLLLWSLAAGGTAAQERPVIVADAIDRSRELSTRPVPKAAPPPAQPAERPAPEKGPQEIVVPPNRERTPTDRPWPAPPPTIYGTPGENPPRSPGR